MEIQSFLEMEPPTRPSPNFRTSSPSIVKIYSVRIRRSKDFAVQKFSKIRLGQKPQETHPQAKLASKPDILSSDELSG